MRCIHEIGGNKMNTPARLAKQETPSFEDKLMEKIESWAIAHATIILMVCFAMLIALFVVLIFALTGVSATDSGIQYNHFQDVI